MATTRSLRNLSESIISERDRYCDLRVKWLVQDSTGRVQPGAEVLLEAGGRWDRLSKNWAGRGETFISLELHAGQLEAARFLVRWFRARASGQIFREADRSVFSVMLHGGRRAGKTDLAIKAALTYAVLRPRSNVWLISENIPKTEELEGEVFHFLPRAWYEHRGAPRHDFRLANGSTIWLRSAHEPESLKRGRCDFAVLNEAQQMAEESFAIVRPATADSGGLTLLANNPWSQPIGAWTETFYEEARAGKRPAKEFRLDAALNPHVELESLMSLRGELDERTFRREILGEYLAREDIVFHAWSGGKDGNVRPVPELAKDVTRAVTKRFFGREFDYLAGMDFQQIPYCCAVVFKFFEDPDDPQGDPLAWAIDEVAIDQALEEDLSREMIARGYDPQCVAIVADASGAWQDATHKNIKNSHEILKRLGWRFIYKPDRDMEKNPDIIERCKVGNARMKDANGRRRLFSAPENLLLNEAIKKWEMRSGVPYRKSKYAHLCDALTYPLWRLYPRGKKPRGGGALRGESFPNMRPGAGFRL